MEKIWLKSYQEGIPETIDPDKYTSLIDLFEKSCQQFAEKPAVANMGTVLSYAELDNLSRDFAAYLQHTLQIKIGDRVAIMMPNCLQYIIAMFGAMRAGAIIVNVNPLYTADELRHQLKDAGAKAIVVLANFAKTVQIARPDTQLQHVIVTQLGDFFPVVKRHLVNFVVKYIKKMVPAWDMPDALSLQACLTQGKSQPFEKCRIDASDIAYLQYTGGTTGVAKGAMLTHRNLIANVEQATTWIKHYVEDGKEIIITALPLYHIFSLTANCLSFLKHGALSVLITNPRDIRGFIRELSRYQFTAFAGVNTLFNALLNHPKFQDLDFSELKVTLGGGMAVQSDVANRWHQQTDCIITQAYGLTETSPAVSINSLGNGKFNGTIGLPLPSTDVKLINESLEEVAVGEIGELCIQGPQVMQGYWNNEAETKKVLDDEGWLRTGDLVTMDEKGRLLIVDRIKDMILVSGFNVYPNEIEDVIALHPGVDEVGVVGEHCENSGEKVVAYIVKKDQALVEKAVIEHCRSHLTNYKIPKKIVFLDELPKTNVGKILRRALRD